mmetsp:Transcript_32495/g.56612  ORF Transcript_32495/g.56612 Transcript_32495/m.56612 type:complete len:206 (-) Transcript_32495:102-719(-)
MMGGPFPFCSGGTDFCLLYSFFPKCLCQRVQPLLLFSYPIGDDSEGDREYEVVASIPELEVYEGDGILDYPWPKDRDGQYYRRPRGFFGSFEFDRYPCHPLLNFTGWPCPYMRQTERPTAKPTKNPTNAPTVKPAAQTVQTDDQTESDAPDLVSSSGPEAESNNTNDTTLKVGVQAEETSNGVIVSWKVAYRSCGCGLAILLRYL